MRSRPAQRDDVVQSNADCDDFESAFRTSREMLESARTRRITDQGLTRNPLLLGPILPPKPHAFPARQIMQQRHHRHYRYDSYPRAIAAVSSRPAANLCAASPNSVGDSGRATVPRRLGAVSRLAFRNQRMRDNASHDSPVLLQNRALRDALPIVVEWARSDLRAASGSMKSPASLACRLARLKNTTRALFNTLREMAFTWDRNPKQE